MGQALEMCVHCETKRSCDTCTELHNWIMERLEYEPVKRGRWTNYKNTETVICSECNFGIEPYQDWFNYCPNCGARMDEE